MSFTINRQCAVVKNYPELGIMKSADSEMLTITYEAVIINSVAAGLAEVQFRVKSDGIGEGLITFSFAVEDAGNILLKAEEALKEYILKQ